MYSFDLPVPSLCLDTDEIYEAMGYGSVSPSEPIKEMTAELLDGIPGYIKVSGLFTVYPASVLQDSVEMQDTRFQTGATIASLLKDSTEMAVFVATAGKGFERWNQEMAKEQNWVIDFIVDAIGTCLVEKAGDYLEKCLEQRIDKGMTHTNRFSPGYCGWNIEEQRELFRLLPPEVLGVQLSESCMMSPIKSISGFIGIGKKVKAKLYGCDVCELQTCFRKKKNRK